MGMYLNPGNDGFCEAVNSDIYVDKTELIEYTNSVYKTEQKNVCISRPRRFGKSMAAKMLSAYYSKGCDSKELFSKYKIAQKSRAIFEKYLNKCNVIFLNMQEFLSETKDVKDMIEQIKSLLLWDIMNEYPEVKYFDKKNLVRSLSDLYMSTKCPIVLIIDEWDCLFREYSNDVDSQKIYLDFLRNLIKDKTYIGLAYMTGILPIKKYGSHSALNMFDEFSMVGARQLSKMVGFTEDEVMCLCQSYNRDYAEIKRWYDGYYMKNVGAIFSPKSVITAILSGEYATYWNQTETFEALKAYISMNYNGLRDSVIRMLAGEHVSINPCKFSNDMSTFESMDDVCTLLVHLGYLAYDSQSGEAYIPNKEVSMEYINAMEDSGWEEVMKAVKKSKQLLEAVMRYDNEFVAMGVEEAHFETSAIRYNDENSLSCIISLAFYAARQYYTIVREMPSGKGFADMVLLPRKRYADKPAMVIELKYDKSAKGAISQIKERVYTKSLEEYKDNILLVGINYDKNSKKHECKIELHSN